VIGTVSPRDGSTDTCPSSMEVDTKRWSAICVGSSSFCCAMLFFFFMCLLSQHCRSARPRHDDTDVLACGEGQDGMSRQPARLRASGAALVPHGWKRPRRSSRSETSIIFCVLSVCVCLVCLSRHVRYQIQLLADWQGPACPKIRCAISKGMRVCLVCVCFDECA
jgi:hypothetical protein